MRPWKGKTMRSRKLPGISDPVGKNKLRMFTIPVWRKWIWTLDPDEFSRAQSSESRSQLRKLPGLSLVNSNVTPWKDSKAFLSREMELNARLWFCLSRAVFLYTSFHFPRIISPCRHGTIMNHLRIIEGNFEIKLPTIWIDRKAEVGQ